MEHRVDAQLIQCVGWLNVQRVVVGKCILIFCDNHVFPLHIQGLETDLFPCPNPCFWKEIIKVAIINVYNIVLQILYT